MNKTPRLKNLETPYKDIHGQTIKIGDVIIFGMLGQHWLVKKAKRTKKYYSGYVLKAGTLIMEICSDDSGKGHWEELSSDLNIPENGTEICKDHCYN